MLRISFAAACVAALTACGSGEDRMGFDEIEVSGGEAPSVTVSDLGVDEPQHRVLVEGDGEAIERGDSLAMDILAINGNSGDELENSFLQDHTPSFTLDATELREEIIDALVGQNVGARVLIAVPMSEAEVEQGQLGLGAGDALVFLVQVVEKVEAPTEPDRDSFLSAAEGEEQSVPDSVPALTVEDGEPTGFTAGPGVPAEVGEAEAVVAIQGAGAQIEAGSTIAVHYHGQIYPEGETFDSSWERGQPAEFPIGVGGVIDCWDDGLVGQTIGSRLILVCPADTAYGDQGSPPTIQPGDTLIFAVDLLGAY